MSGRFHDDPSGDVGDLSRTAEDDRDRGTRRRPGATDPTESGGLSVASYTQDLVDAEFVLESDDAFVPDGVDGAGVVVLDDDSYVGLLSVRPRSWSIHTAERKQEIVATFQSSVLAPLEFPLQIVAYPTDFDISDHVAALADVTAETSDSGDLLAVGRDLYPAWLRAFIEENDTKQRRFYVVVPVSADGIRQFENREGLAATVAERVPPLAPLLDRLTDSPAADVTRRQCLRELDARLTQVEAGLRRLDVRAERLGDRQETLAVLAQYYNNRRPPVRVGTGGYTVREQAAGGDR